MKKPCETCKWFQNDFPGTELGFCLSPRRSRCWQLWANLQREQNWFWAWHFGSCGRKGKFWEAKQP